MTALLEARGIRKVFAGGDGQPLEVLRGVELDFSSIISCGNSPRWRMS